MMKRLLLVICLISCCTLISAQSSMPIDLGKASPFPEKFFHLSTRGSLKNSFLKFQKGGEVRVAFLGGSITEMKGWHNMLEDTHADNSTPLPRGYAVLSVRWNRSAIWSGAE